MPNQSGPIEPSNLSGASVIIMDGIPVALPKGRSSLNSIRCYLETLALEKRQVLSALCVNGHKVNLSHPLPNKISFSRIEAETVGIEDHNLLVLATARAQTIFARDAVETALTLVLINNAKTASELWWGLALNLKEPVVTLSLLPDDLCRSTNGGAHPKQLRKWQLEQISIIIRAVDQACAGGDTIQISNALETRVLPWLDKLSDLIELWLETERAAKRLGLNSAGAPS